MSQQYFYLVQMLLLMALILGVYGFTIHLPPKRCLLRCFTTVQTHPVYHRFEYNLSEKDVFAYEKYEIWRFIERTKSTCYF